MAQQSALYQLAIELGLDTADLKKGAADAIKSLSRFEQAAVGVDKQLAGLGQAFGTAIKGFAAVFGVRELIQFAGVMRDIASQVGDTAERIGITTDALQGLQFGASLAGLPVDQLTDSLNIFVRHLGEAQQGTGDFAKEAAKLGMLGGGTVEENLRQFADAIAKVPTQTEKMRLAVIAFGRDAGPKWVNVLSKGADGIDEMTESAKKAGVVIDGSVIAKTKQWDEELARLQKQIQFSLGLPLLNAVAAAAGSFNAIRYAVRVTTITVADEFERMKQRALATFDGLSITDLLTPNPALLLAKVAARAMSGEGQKLIDERMHAVDDALDRETAQLEEDAIGWVEHDAAVMAAAATYGKGSSAVDAFATAQDKAKEKIVALEAELTDLNGTQQKNLELYRESVKLWEDAHPLEVAAINLREVEDGFRVGAASAERLIQAQQELRDAASAPIVDKSDELAKELDASAKAIEDSSKKAATAVDNLAQEFSGDLTDALFGAHKGFLDFAESFLEQIAKMIVQAQIFSALSKVFAGSSWLSKLIPTSAEGNVFGPAGLMAFARGGVVGGPTLFPFATGVGMMGESGPEAIMPLTRRNGRLGVEGGGVTVNVVNNAGADVSVQSDPGGQQIDILIERKIAGVFRSGALDRQMRANYGVRRRGE